MKKHPIIKTKRAGLKISPAQGDVPKNIRGASTPQLSTKDAS